MFDILWRCLLGAYNGSFHASDIRSTTHIINNLLYLSPTRHLLYVTDSDIPTFDRASSITHIFEHLSCFLPGLLSLGAHTLPLDNLHELGIALDVLGNETLYGYAGKGYHRLKNYNLKELHMWAAEGLAQTCWITYADQPTGLGPDEVMMATVYAPVGSMAGSKSESYLWIDALDKWKKSGGHGVIPGLADHKPVMYTDHQRLHGTGKGRDYVLRKPGYLLRPEVSFDHISSIFIGLKAFFLHRPSNLFIYCGAPQEIRNGGFGRGAFLKPLKNKRRRAADMRAFCAWILYLLP